MAKNLLLVFSFMLLTPCNCLPQQRLQPSKTYTEGDTIVAPLYGISFVIPDHWSGFLTRETQVFTLNSDTTGDVKVIVFPSEGKLEDIEARWSKGVELSPEFKVMPTGALVVSEGELTCEFHLENNESLKGYVLAKCGGYGHCYTMVLTAPYNIYTRYKTTLHKLSGRMDFVEPSITGPYEEFDWSETLSHKYLFTYQSGGGSTKGNHLWLCPDGTFHAKLQRRGLLKDAVGDYKGRHTGTYQTEGKGPSGKLLLRFKELSSLDLNLEIKDDLIFINGERYSIAENKKCK